MLKLLTLSTAALLPMVAAASAAEVSYVGEIIWTKVNTACSSNNGPSAGERDRAVFHPKAIPGNGAFSSLNTFWGYGASGATLNNANFGPTLQIVDNRGVGEGPYDPRADSVPGITKVSITSVQPSYSPPPTTIRLEGQIQNPWTDNTLNACIVDYMFTGVRSN